MTDQNYPITPPPDLVEQWHDAWIDAKVKHDGLIDFLAAQAAQWGANQELEATLKLMATLNIRGVDYVRNARRSARAPSLKEQALALLDKAENPSWDINDFSIIRQALEALDD